MEERRWCPRRGIFVGNERRRIRSVWCFPRKFYSYHDVAARWPSIPFYVVGQATASALLSVRAIYDNSPYAPGPALGESSGTSEQLVNFILSLEGSSRPKKLLYLTGDKNRDTVPRILGEAGIAVNPIKVYETQFSSSFTQDLETALQSASKGSRSFVSTFTTASKSFHFICRIRPMVDCSLRAILR